MFFFIGAVAPIVGRIYLTPLTLSPSSHVTFGDLEFQKFQENTWFPKTRLLMLLRNILREKIMLKVISYKRNPNSIVLDQIWSGTICLHSFMHVGE